MPQITSHTSQAEIDAIRQHYTLADGSVDTAAMEDDLQNGRLGNYSAEDILTTYYLETSTVPAFILALEANPGSPDDYNYLWEQEVIDGMTQLGDLQTQADPDITSFLRIARANSDLGERTDDFLNRILNEAADVGGFDPSDPVDLKEIMSLFLGMGNPGTAILLYAAYGLSPAMREVQEAALEVLDEAPDTIADLQDELEANLDTDDPTASAESERIRQQMSVINQVVQTMSAFIKDSQDVINNMIQLASQLSESTRRNEAAILRS